ncbi:hypothetical protein WJX81_001789 [Elliptochloris bilobata]|uniref:ABC transporter domain-containing protein n=1 Tax=Elliptochloris bilobata TaxID=381761 RepID=A0AAW1RFV7_9CHLO
MDVHVTFGNKRVLRGASLAVVRGSLHVLLGPNGCGKSTLLRVLGRQLAPAAGSARTDGPISFVFQNPDHQIVMPTVAADVAFGLGRYTLPATAVRAQVAAALATVGLAAVAQRPTHTLSGGQRQRCAIAGALAQAPKVLLLDELTTFLDGGDQRGVLEAVRACVGGPDQVTALWVTHRLEELAYADAASFMDGGRVQVTGSPAEVAEHMRRLGARW